MYSKELYEKYKEVRKRAARKYYQKNKKKLLKKNREYKAKNAKWREYEKECSKLCKLFLYPEEIPELEYYGCVSDLNYKIEKGGYINGSKC